MILRRLSYLGVFVCALWTGCGGAQSNIAANPEFDFGSTTLGSPAQFGEFGAAVAFLGDVVAIGAPDEQGGKVHLYRRSNGEFLRTVESPGGGSHGRFGAALAAWGGDLLVGAPVEGKVYLLDGVTGELRVAFEPGDEEQPGDFGAAIAVVGAQLWVGAPGREGAAGEVFRFALPGGALLGRFLSPNSEVGGGFGAALSGTDTVGIIGAEGESRAYVFDTQGLLVHVVQEDAEGFGSAVAIGEREFAVGAPDQDAGQAFVFDADTATLRNTLTPPGSDTRFGLAVAVADGEVVVASAGKGPQVHMFDPLNGTLQQSSESQSEELGSPAGISLVVEGGYALVGAFQLPGEPRGLAQAVDCRFGTIFAFFSAPTPNSTAAFGNAVAFVNSFLVVGEPRFNASDDGAIHVYAPNGVFQRTIQNPNGGDAGHFGHAIAVYDNDTVIVGAPDATFGSFTGQGRAYLVNILTGVIERTFESPNPVDNGRFGFAVTAVVPRSGPLAGDLPLEVGIGAPGENRSEGAEGMAYTFDTLGNTLLEIFNPNPTGSEDEFGFCMSSSFAGILIGAPGAFGDEGEAYLIDQLDGDTLNTFDSISGGNESERFGQCVLIAGTEFWISAPNLDFFDEFNFAQQAGVVRVFDSQFNDIADVFSNDPQDFAEFGFSLAYDESQQRVAIGCPGESAIPEIVLQGPVPNPDGVVHVIDRPSKFREQRFTSAGPESGGRFGHSVDIEFDRVIGGAIHETAAGPTANAGRVTVHLLDSVEVVFNADDPIDFAQFGECIAQFDVDTMLVGAPGAAFGDGAAYLINVNTREIELEIPSVLGDEGFAFGFAVAVLPNGDLVIGQPDADAVYVFTSAGSLLQEINTPAIGTGTFGFSIAIVNGNILIGEPGGNNDAGAAYLFTPGGTLLQTFAPGSTGNQSAFGFKVAAIGNDCLISSPGEPAPPNRLGIVYIFNSATGVEEMTFISPDAVPNAFGSAIAEFNGNVLASSLAGQTVWLLDRGTGNVLQAFNNPDPGNGFGTSMAQIQDRQIAIGGGNVAPGIGYLFDQDGALQNTYMTSNIDPADGNFGVKVIAFNNGPAFSSSTEEVNPINAGRVYVYGATQQFDPPEEEDDAIVLESPTPTSGDEFGFSVYILGTSVFVGAPGASNGEGVLYEFDGTNEGAFDGSFTSPNAVAGGRWAHAVAANAVVAAIGAPGETGGALLSGRAYLVSSVNGAILLQFISSCPKVGGGFGTSVALTRTNVAVGAPFEDEDGIVDAGHVHYFDCIVPNAITKLKSPNSTQGGRYGADVATIDFDVYGSAPGEPNGGTLAGNGANARSGNVYCHNGLTGVLILTIPNPNPETDANFGAKIILFGTNGLLIAAPGATSGGVANAGRVYLVNRTTGAVIQTFDPPNPQAGMMFGGCIATDGTDIFISAPCANDDEGEVYRFDTNGVLGETIFPPNPESGAKFGFSIFADGADNGVAGAPGQTVGQVENAGAAYVNPGSDEEEPP